MSEQASNLGTLSPDLAARWIKVNIVVALLVAVASLTQSAIVGMLDAHAAGATRGAVIASYAFAIILYGLVGMANAVLVGAVLQRILRDLPVQRWIVLQVIIGVFYGVLGELLATSGEAARSAPVEGRALASSMIFGGIVGLLQATVEATVLIRVARGVGAWIGWSAAGSAMASAVWAIGWWFWPPPTDAIGNIVNQVYSIAGAVVAAVVTLLAISRLEPRQSRP